MENAIVFFYAILMEKLNLEDLTKECQAFSTSLMVKESEVEKIEIRRLHMIIDKIDKYVGYKLGFKILKISYKALGHSITDPICYEWWCNSSKINRRAICFYNDHTAASGALLCSYKFKNILFIQNSLLAEIIHKALLFTGNLVDLSGICIGKKPGSRWGIVDFLNSNNSMSNYIDTNFTQKYMNQFKEFMNSNCLSSNRYICMHIRSPYYSSDVSNEHSHRNTNTYSVIRAIEYFSDVGVKIVRMGTSHMPKMSHDNLIDYATSPYQSGYLDLLIAKNCMFFFGDSSGGSLYSLLFDKRLYTFNCCLPQLTMMRKYDISIFMRFYDLLTGNLLSFKQLVNRGAFYTDSFTEFTRLNIGFLPNTDIEILELAKFSWKMQTETFNWDSFDSIPERDLLKRILPNDCIAIKMMSQILPSFIQSHKYLLS